MSGIKDGNIRNLISYHVKVVALWRLCHVNTLALNLFCSEPRYEDQGNDFVGVPFCHVFWGGINVRTRGIVRWCLVEEN